MKLIYEFTLHSYSFFSCTQTKLEKNYRLIKSHLDMVDIIKLLNIPVVLMFLLKQIF